MKRLLTILAVLCLMLGCINEARAAITVTEQPETQTVKAGGSVIFSVKAKDAGKVITWHFVSPDGGEDITGKKLSGRFKGLKVSNPNTLNIKLKNVPEEMHGWTVYCHLGKTSAGLDTETAMLLIEGKELPGEESGLGPTVEQGDDESDLSPAAEQGESEEAKDDEKSEAPDEEEGPDESEEAEADGEVPKDWEEPEAETEETGAAAGVGGETAEGSAAENGQIRGFIEDQDYQYMQLGSYYYSENGGKKPLVWRVLYRKGNIAQLITENVIDAMQMIKIEDFYTAVKKRNYKSKFNTPYEEMDIYYWLNGEMAEVIFENQDFSSAIVPHKITESKKGETDVPEEPGYQAESGGNLSADEKEKFPYGKDLFYIMTYADMKNGIFGFPKTTHGNTKENEGEIAVPESGRRKAYATPYAKSKVQYPDWKKNTAQYKLDVVTVYEGMTYGGSSPYWTIKRRPGYYMSGIVGANGHLSWSNMASVRVGVRPATIIDLNRLRVTGGNGTLESPWVMEVLE